MNSTGSRDEQVYITDFSDFELELAKALKFKLPDKDKGVMDDGGCICRRTLRSEGRACGNHSFDIGRLFAIRDFIDQYTNQRLKDFKEAVEGAMPSKPFEVGKTPKPVMENVTESVGVGVLQTTRDTGHTYTEQDMEDAAFETAKPYLVATTSAISEIYSEFTKEGGNG